MSDDLLRETIVARNAIKTHCPKGHLYDTANTYWQGEKRSCKTCRHDSMRKFRRLNPTYSRDYQRARKMEVSS
jgi:hypothetical protein